jgi:tripartite-type tricarboxylate transporter receptor subunit TctC
LPEVPAVAELGFKDYDAEVWPGVVAPAKTPRHMISQIASWFAAAVDSPSVKLKLAAQRIFAKPVCGAEFGAFLQTQRDQYFRIITEANIKGE